MKNVHIIINPISGTSSKDKIPELAKELLPSDKFTVNIKYTEYAGHAAGLTKKAVDEDADYIIAVGGDGTINEVAKSMVHTKAALGIIPLGSGNGLARDLGIPIDIKKAMTIISKENVIAMDYCMANEHVFFCTCGFGFDAIVSERFSGEKHRGSIAYLKSIISEYLKFKPDYYEVIFGNDEVVKEKAFLVTCANTSQYGFNAYIAPHANIRDGKMDVVIMSPINPLEAGPMAVMLFAKQIDKNNKINYLQSEQVLVKRSKPGVMHIDGDPIKVGEEILIKNVPLGLNVIVPLKEDRQSPIMAQIQDVQSFFREIPSWIEDIKP